MLDNLGLRHDLLCQTCSFPCQNYFNLRRHDLPREMITPVYHGNSGITLPDREQLMAGIQHCYFFKHAINFVPTDANTLRPSDTYMRQ